MNFLTGNGRQEVDKLAFFENQTEAKIYQGEAQPQYPTHRLHSMQQYVSKDKLQQFRILLHYHKIPKVVPKNKINK